MDFPPGRLHGPSGQSLANARVSRLDRLIDQVATLAVRQERALHGINGNFFEVLEGETERSRRRFELLAHSGVTHQAVIRVQGDPEFLLVQNFERMLRQTRSRPGVYIAEKADLERDALVQNILGEVSQLHRSALRHGDVLYQPCTVTDAVCPAILNRLPDGFFPKAFPGMNRDIEILALDVMKGVD